MYTKIQIKCSIEIERHPAPEISYKPGLPEFQSELEFEMGNYRWYSRAWYLYDDGRR